MASLDQKKIDLSKGKFDVSDQEILQNALKCFKMLQNASKLFKMLQMFPNCFKMGQNA